MAQLGGMFDATQVEPQGDYTPIPPGDYTVQIVTSQMVETSNRNGHMLKLELEILDGEHAGRRLYDRLNLENPNRQAVEIAQRTLSAICHAIGKLSVQDSEELHMQPMTAVVAIKAPSTGRDGKTYAASNEIKTYKVLRDAPAPVSSGSAFRPAQAGSGQMASAPWKRSA